ncbi:hypothetical protein D1632_08630 [Chryseobacterium nematophagum]|uniref:Aerolysin family beta-barrel pore-forming toxin n=1 Tax=Chryseobacterium nematophagum TaxID=2305228 RepID=A0A3M7LCF7_9FLAO|nr:hypothetical protein [Chryseobacterium nematophagum]RMZ59680.1 hypothetical protein D1632_08630 [Chryseobacterium nematophagum]
MKKQTIFTLAIFLLASCSHDLKQDADDSINSAVKGKQQLSESEMLKNGWEIVKEINLLEGSGKLNNTNPNVLRMNSDQQIPLTAQHLKDLGYDISSSYGKNKLKGVFSLQGKVPDGVKFNSSLSVDGHPGSTASAPNVSVVVGTPLVTVNTLGFDLPDQSFTTEAVNYDPTLTKEITVSYSYKTGYKTTWKVVASGSLKLGAKASVGVPGVGSTEYNTEVTVGGQVEQATETANEQTITSSVKVVVPPRSKKTVAILSKTQESTANYFIPISVTGGVQSNFSSPVNGSYFWGSSITSYPNFISNINGERGIAKVVSNVSVKVITSLAQSL